MSVSWGKRERFKFNTVGSLISWEPPPLSGVFAVTYKQDPAKKSHTVLFFGQAEDLSREAPDLNRRVLDLWTEGGNDVRELTVWIHPMPGSTSQQRSRIQEELIAEYRPQCNRY